MTERQRESERDRQIQTHKQHTHTHGITRGVSPDEAKRQMSSERLKTRADR